VEPVSPQIRKPKSEGANMPGDGGAGNENKETKKRNKNWTRPETMAAMHAALGTNEKMAMANAQQIV